jgi:phytoene dehydrogenase-like protein
VDGLYLSGAGTYPGAGIVGMAGRNVADTVLGDLSGSLNGPASRSGVSR